jgi:hypothetical protein
MHTFVSHTFVSHLFHFLFHILFHFLFHILFHILFHSIWKAYSYNENNVIPCQQGESMIGKKIIRIGGEKNAN